ncbi:MAG: hypothetical protein HFACDABA_00254 [Anaerolineales bacterium]|nr:hypothetical protein [Anaerolineales bacterium]
MFTKNSRNRFDKKDSLELGQKAEDAFARLALQQGWKVEPASEAGNIDDHYDYLISKESQTFKVEVKGKKRVNRSDAGTQDELIWVELHGVREKDPGWLFGKADLIAFELTTSFRIVKRVDLVKVINSRLDFNAHVSKPEKALYKQYSRPGRYDSLTMIQAEDLKKVIWEEWAK